MADISLCADAYNCLHPEPCYRARKDIANPLHQSYICFHELHMQTSEDEYGCPWFIEDMPQSKGGS